MEVHDLALAKLAAGRPHDYDFVDETIRSVLVDVEQLHLGVELLPASVRDLTRERLKGAIARANRTQADAT